MLIVTKKFGYRRNETKDECQENSCQRGDQSKTGGEHGVGMLLLIVGIAEKGSFHSKGQQDQNEDSIGINVGGDTVVARLGGHIMSVERDEHVVEETSDDAAQTIDGSIFC